VVSPCVPEGSVTCVKGGVVSPRVLEGSVTCVQEGVAVAPDDHVDPADALGDEPVHREARVAQSHDVDHAEQDQLVHLLLHRRDLVQEPQVRT